MRMTRMTMRMAGLVAVGLTVTFAGMSFAADTGGTEGADDAAGVAPAPYFIGQEYSVAPGDTLWDLSGRNYTIPYYWPHIWNNNRSVTDPDVISTGETLWLPTLQGAPGTLTPADRHSIALGYMQLYDHYTARGLPNPEYALVGARYYDPSVLPPELQTTQSGAGSVVSASEGAATGERADDAGRADTRSGADGSVRSTATGANTAAKSGADRRAGIPVGSFRFNAGVSLSRRHDDNLFATRTDTDSAPYTVVEPWVSLESDWERHAVGLSASAETADFSGYGDEDYTDGSIRLEGRYDVAAGSNVFGSLSAARGHEDRTAVNVPGAAAEPTTFRERQAVVGTAQRFGNTELRIGVTGLDLDFDDVPLTGGGTSNNDDRDREVYEVGGRLTALRPGGWQPFAQAALNERTYDEEQDDLGFERSSSGATVGFGALRPVSGGYAELFVGYMQQDYDDPRFGTVESPDLGARLNTVLTNRTKLTARLDRSIGESTVVDAAATVDTVASTTLRHRMTSRASFSVPTYWVRSEFERTSRNDEVTGIGVTFDHQLTRYMSLYAGYAFERRDSSLSSADYEKGTTFAGLAAELAPAPIPPLSAGGSSGPYIGAQVGPAMLGADVSGPRGAAGTLDTELGDWSGVGGAFAGYGWSRDRWLVGLELEVDDANDSWDHDRRPSGNNFSLNRQESYAASARLGYWLDSAALLYASAGLAKTEFRAQFESGSGATADVTERPRGVRFGTGIELVMSDRWFGRLGWSFTDYHPIDVDYGTATDEFSPSEQRIMLGLGYRFFDAGSSRAPSYDASVFDGVYLGAGIGRGALHTENTGDQRGSTGTGELTVDRADAAGALSVFGGYGKSFGSLYLGAELEAERSDAGWKSARLPSRRVYEVDRGSSLGASLRAGYIVDGGALLYVRGGRVRTEFDTDYRFAGEGVDIEEEGTLTGDRVGLGVEVAASENMFVRLDYSYTDYESYAIDYSTSTGNGTETFDNDEDLVRVGVGYRF